eukprot:m51a1_g606 hypothetical protein (294) ;mRNA; r:85534-86972
MDQRRRVPASQTKESLKCIEKELAVLSGQLERLAESQLQRTAPSPQPFSPSPPPPPGAKRPQPPPLSPAADSDREWAAAEQDDAPAAKAAQARQRGGRAELGGSVPSAAAGSGPKAGLLDRRDASDGGIPRSRAARFDDDAGDDGDRDGGGDDGEARFEAAESTADRRDADAPHTFASSWRAAEDPSMSAPRQKPKVCSARAALQVLVESDDEDPADRDDDRASPEERLRRALRRNKKLKLFINQFLSHEIRERDRHVKIRVLELQLAECMQMLQDSAEREGTLAFQNSLHRQ